MAMAASSGTSRTSAGTRSRPACWLARQRRGDDLVAAALDRTHDDGLHHAVIADRLRQFFQRLRIHVATGLILAALNQFQR